MSAEPTAPLPPAAHPGPRASDDTLAAWHAAARAGDLPLPARDRWQVLRSGVVNLWEYDVAEYWFADGRAQLVGQNQSGKSTLMALTTLILLAGDLDRALVDTFGEHHKSFRYYVEPTDDPTDRRDTDTSLNRGWAWVEYGRLDPDGTARYFTTMLYAQARRGANDYVKQWLTCEGDARVGRELALHTGAATRQPGDLADVPGYRLARTSKEYSLRVATALFGFADTDRLDAVVRMLKVLRTPHLGQRLNPDFFTTQMRQALPAIAKTEIDQLAEGWDQLDQLAADRDSAKNARDAVESYVRRAWGPWADAVLRKHADDLVSATTQLDNVTRRAREAEDAHKSASRAQTDLAVGLATTQDEHGRVDARYEDHLRSQAYLDARQATADVERLQRRAREKAAAATRAGQTRDAAGAKVTAAQTVNATDAAALAAAEKVRGDAASTAGAAANGAGLPERCATWAQEGEIDRLNAAVAGRRADVGAARTFASNARAATAKAQRAADRAQDLEKALHGRQNDADAAEQDLTATLEALSDAVEAWAATVPNGAPDLGTRGRWVDAITAQTVAPRPRSILAALIRDEWLTPATEPLRVAATELRREAREASDRASELHTAADTREAQRDPVAEEPTRWARRVRPNAGRDGAPLWLLVDPVPDLPRQTLNHLEAALSAWGLLDSWVTPDGVYNADRDRADTVLTLPAHPGHAGLTLRDVLVPAAAGPLADVVAATLGSIGYCGAGDLPGQHAICADGRWRDGAREGRAAPPAHGAELIGTAARAAARAREVAALRAQAQQLQTCAATLTEQANAHHQTVTALMQAAAAAPADDAMVHAAHTAHTARRELAAARTASEPATRAAAEADTRAQEANATLLEFTAPRRLPHDEAALEQVSVALGKATDAISQLQVAVVRCAGAVIQEQRSAGLLEQARRDFDAAATQASDAIRDATTAGDEARDAEGRLGADEQALLATEDALRTQRKALADRIAKLQGDLVEAKGTAATAEAKLQRASADRAAVEEIRAGALQRWWIPVEQGLAERRHLPAPAGRLLSHALAQARAAREQLRPPGWPDAGAQEKDAKAQEKDAKVNTAWTKVTGGPLTELRSVLESSGGRSVTVTDSDDPAVLPTVGILVDATGTQVDPVEAIEVLHRQAERLAGEHDEQIQKVLVELLSSTFVEHLRERLTAVVELLDRVNTVLAAHPTGQDRTSLRLRRIPSSGQWSAFDVLDSLERGFVDSPQVQEQVREFLAQQIRFAQDLGRGGPKDWKEHLVDQLDYRLWFDVVTEYRVGQTPWKPLTKETHAKDSGGGKVITLLQPLLATLVALYGQSPGAPRPLWLDEAFTGVDDANRATMLGMLVTFDLDFLLAGPGTLVSVAQVPAAAVWFITRAPAPIAGVDLSLLLWAGRTLTSVPLPARTLEASGAAVPAGGGPDLFDFDKDNA